MAVQDGNDALELSEEISQELQKIPGSMIAFEQAEITAELIDHDLVKKAIDGDKKAFSELFMLTYRYVYIVAKHYLSDDEDVYDAIQETYIKVYHKLHLLRKPEAFYSWLNRVAQNCAKDILARTAPQVTELSEAEQEFEIPDELNDELFGTDTALDITAVLKEMPEQEARLLVMVYYDGMKIAEIARLLHQPASTVYSRFHTARKRLKKLLKARGIDKPLYGGGFITMVATSLRDAIGTELLSAAIAEEILHSVMNAKEKGQAVISKITRQQRNRAVLRIASLIVVISLLTSGAVAGLVFLQWKDGMPTLQVQSGKNTVSGISLSESDASTGASASSAPGSSTASTSSALSSSSASASSGAVSAVGSSQAVSSALADTFVPDYSPGQENTVGNFPNNVGANRGLVAKQADWIYYAQGNGFRYLMKMKTDGSEKQMIMEHDSGFEYINVIEDWIYHCGNGVWRMRTDGSKRELVSTLNARFLTVIGNTGYFMDFEGDKLYALDLRTKKTTLLRDIAGGQIVAVQEDVLLYIDNATLYSMDRDSKEHRTVYEGVTNCLVDGNMVYMERNYDHSILVKDHTKADSQVTSIGVEAGLGMSLLSRYQGGVIGYWKQEYDPNIDGESEPKLFFKLVSVSGQEIANTMISFADQSFGFYSFGEDEVYFYTSEMELCRSLPDGTNYRKFE